MIHKVRAFWRAQAFAEHATVFCAVSGGADSVAMLHCLYALREEFDLTLRAAHFNHHLRGAESDRDEAFVRALCQSLNIPLTVSGADVAALAAQSGESLEEAARHARYAFFDTLHAPVATAHTADDHLETVLLNLVRGTGLQGLCGIPAQRGAFFRPLLSCTRQEVLVYLDALGALHVEDSTNAQPDCLRNRLRQQVVPLLRQENPALAQTTLHMTQLLRDDDALLDEAARAALTAARQADGWRCSVLLAHPAALRARAVRLLLRDAGIPRVTHRHIDAVCALLTQSAPAARCDLPGGLCAMRAYDLLRLCPPPRPAHWQSVPLRLDHWTSVAPLGLRVFCTRTKKLSEFEENTSTFALRYDTIDLNTLCLRPRATGDRIRLAAGSRSVKRLMIDRRVAQPLRAQMPILADAHGVAAIFDLCAAHDRIAGIGEDALLIKTEKEDASRYD